MARQRRLVPVRRALAVVAGRIAPVPVVFFDVQLRLLETRFALDQGWLLKVMIALAW
ncbi:hypothetical protein C7S14_3618 [Burkholderia cepacia]|nr:hypothetical protein C7S14_3618 [Burkholderia cepacia]